MRRTLLLFALSFIMLAGCTQSPEAELEKGFTDGPPVPVMESNPITAMEAKPAFDQTAGPEAGDKVAVIETTLGTIKIRLFPEKAPKTVENFVGLIEKGYYDGIIFHRVIPDFMIQGGDPTGTGRGGESLWGGKFEDEFSPDVKNIRGALSMANSGPNTNGSQFFIVQAEATPWLNGLHTVFGQVYEGMEVVDAIATAERGPGDKPVKDIVMKKVTVEVIE
jgi:cyclophilin family peptidyl-prolyl cis-trans isomerase